MGRVWGLFESHGPKAILGQTPRELYQILILFQRQAERGTNPITAEEAEALAKARASMNEVVVQLDRVVFDRGKNGFYLMNGERAVLNGMIRILGDDPPPDEPTPPITSPRGPPEPPPGGPAGVMLCDPVFEAKLADATGLVEALRPTFKERAFVPRVYASDLGRKVASSADIDSNRFEFDRLFDEKGLTRLDERYKDFGGRVDPNTKQLYPFEQVKELKTLAPVGGGIHLGGTASPTPGVDAREYVLRYDVKDKALLMVGPKGETFRRGPIEPGVVKALLQFCRTNQNCAISIGWSGESSGTANSSSGQTVFIDPIFVDTPIGQDLFLADKLPWALDRPEIAAGVPNPIQADFAKARAAFNARRQDEIARNRATVASYLAGIEPFGESDTRHRINVADKYFVADLAIESLIESRTSTSAKARFLGSIGAPDEGALDRAIAGLAPSDSSPRALGFRAEKYYCKWFDDHPDRREALLPLIGNKVGDGLRGGKLTKDLIQLQYSLMCVKTPDLKPEAYAGAVLKLMPSTTLAVLIDEPTRFSLRDRSLVLEGGMRYHYVTQNLTVDGDGLRAVDPQDPSNEVRKLDELAKVANEAFSKLCEAYKPLRDVVEYARVAAFLRWAIQDGNLRGYDFSSLASVATSDRERTPTPDYIR